MAQLVPVPAPVPTPGQRAASHLIVGIVAGVVVHIAINELTDVSSEGKLLLSTLSAIGVAYVHERLDAPVAQYIALKAA